MWKAESGWWMIVSEREVGADVDEWQLEFESEIEPLLVFEGVRFAANYKAGCVNKNKVSREVSVSCLVQPGICVERVVSLVKLVGCGR